MAKSIYSYGGSKLHLRMDDSLAEAYNRGIDAWFQSQVDFEKKYGRKPKTVEDIGLLRIKATKQEMNAWNKVADTLNDLIKNGLELSTDDCPDDDRLIKL